MRRRICSCSLIEFPVMANSCMQQMMRSGAAASVVRTPLAITLLVAVVAQVRPALALDFFYEQNANGQTYFYRNPQGHLGSANWPINNNWNQELQTFIDGVGDTIVSAPSNWATPGGPINYYPGSPNDPDPTAVHSVDLGSFTVNGNGADATLSSLNIGSGGVLNMVGGKSLTIISTLNIGPGGLLHMVRNTGGDTSLTMGGGNATVTTLNIGFESSLSVDTETSLTGMPRS